MPTPFVIHLPSAVARPQEPTSTPDKPTGVAGGQPAGGGNAQVQTPDPRSSGGPVQQCTDWQPMAMMGGVLALMYFLMLRPEQKRRKEQQSLLASMKQGDRVVTVGGQHGVIHSLTDKTVTLRIDTITSVFDRTAIARIDRGEAPGTKA